VHCIPVCVTSLFFVVESTHPAVSCMSALRSSKQSWHAPWLSPMAKKTMPVASVLAYTARYAICCVIAGSVGTYAGIAAAQDIK
jgi:hypothetical protein